MDAASSDNKPYFGKAADGAAARTTIEKVLGEMLASSRPTHTM